MSQSEVEPAPASAGGRASLLFWRTSNGKPQELAPWSRYFITLGERIGSLPSAEKMRLTIAFALPVLDSAAVLIATGLAAERAKIKNYFRGK